MDNPQIQRVLEYWFAVSERDAVNIDSRMDRWFCSDPEFDAEIGEEFGSLVEQASAGQLMNWTETPQGRLALILLLDQFRRNIYRGTSQAFSRDNLALKLSIEGTLAGDHKKLTADERMFFFMPLQHSESLQVQKKSVGIFTALADTVSDTMRETFLTAAQFAELHHDIVSEFGRFPHRNDVMGRANTEEEAAYLTGDTPTFGQ
jgi:uncharacterized protein (DUF924 family)